MQCNIGTVYRFSNMISILTACIIPNYYTFAFAIDGFLRDANSQKSN
jgi:hypothetical protein